MAGPLKIRLGGYGPSTTCFSVALKRIGDRLIEAFGTDVDVHYVYNILDLGYRSEDILWLVEDGFLTLGYQSSSYFESRVPALGVLDLPFIFQNVEVMRGLMDGALGAAIAAELEHRMGYRILGFFENGLRHVSNNIRPVKTASDMAGMRIRVLPSKVQARTFELLGARPLNMDLTDAIEALKNGMIDAQENPLANTATYGAHKYHKFHTLTGHSYLSRPIFAHRDAFDQFPGEVQEVLRDAVREAVQLQRTLKASDDEAGRLEILKEGGEIHELTGPETATFKSAVQPIYDEAAKEYDRELLKLLPSH